MDITVENMPHLRVIGMGFIVVNSRGQLIADSAALTAMKAEEAAKIAMLRESDPKVDFQVIACAMFAAPGSAPALSEAADTIERHAAEIMAISQSATNLASLLRGVVKDLAS